MALSETGMFIASPGAQARCTASCPHVLAGVENGQEGAVCEANGYRVIDPFGSPCTAPELRPPGAGIVQSPATVSGFIRVVDVSNNVRGLMTPQGTIFRSRLNRP